MTDRKKASDVFRDANYVFSKKVSFEEAFPSIEFLSVKVEETGNGTNEWGRTRRHYSHVGEYIDCSNSLCYNGGFSLGEILRAMVEREKLIRRRPSRVRATRALLRGDGSIAHVRTGSVSKWTSNTKPLSIKGDNDA